MIRDGIGVYHSSGVTESCALLRHMLKNYNKFAGGNGKEPAVDYLSSIKINKSENKSSDDGIVIMLSQIPGVSVNMAKKIKSEYPSVHKICEDYENKGENMLATLKVSDKRKLGPKLSKKIYLFLFGTSST
jgi:ERCC4-type nuclease